MGKKVAFYTLGCKLNYSETSTIGRQFNQAGFSTVDFTDTPDVYLINTCSVTDNADKKCRKVVKEALKYSPGGGQVRFKVRRETDATVFEVADKGIGIPRNAG